MSTSPATPATQAVTVQTAPRNHHDEILALVPRALSTHSPIIFLACLGVFAVPLPLSGSGSAPEPN